LMERPGWPLPLACFGGGDDPSAILHPYPNDRFYAKHPK